MKETHPTPKPLYPSKFTGLSPRAARRRLLYGPLIIIALFHALVPLAFYAFTWSGVLIFLALYWATACLGVTLCFHRLVTHQSFKTYPAVKYLLTFFGCLALQGGPLNWAAKHRLHHKESDEEPDPHTPFVSFLWSHVLWLFFVHPEMETEERMYRFVPDLARDPVLRWFDRHFFAVAMLFALVLFGAGYAVGGAALGLSWVLWGVVVRTVFVWHVTWLVNSATHMWGYKNYHTRDNSRNSWWVALLAFGEGWHNNHHADQRSAAHGHRWFEFDMTHWIIQAMAGCGLAWDIVQPQAKRLQSKSERLRALVSAAGAGVGGDVQAEKSKDAA